MTIFDDRASKMVIELNEVLRVWSLYDRISVLIRRDTREFLFEEETPESWHSLPCKDTARRSMCISHEESSHQKLTLLYLGLGLQSPEL